MFELFIGNKKFIRSFFVSERNVNKVNTMKCPISSLCLFQKVVVTELLNFISGHIYWHVIIYNIATLFF